MISSELPCPDEAELVALVDGDLTPDRELDVVTHLAVCADCRGLLGRTEASLRYALGGIADAGDVSDGEDVAAAAGPLQVAPAVAARAGRRRPWLRIVAPLAAAAAVALLAINLDTDNRDNAPAPATASESTTSNSTVAGANETASATTNTAPTSEDSVDARLDALLSRTKNLRDATSAAAHADEEDLLAGLLAAREARDAVVTLRSGR